MTGRGENRCLQFGMFKFQGLLMERRKEKKKKAMGNFAAVHFMCFLEFSFIMILFDYAYILLAQEKVKQKRN